MSNFENSLQGWLDQVGGLVNLTIEEREEINNSGAEVLQSKLTAVTHSKHYRPPAENGKSKRKVAHLADSVVTGPLEGNRNKAGDVAVGFSKTDANHARIARFLNDGTAKMQGDHFWDNAISDVSENIQAKQASTIKQIQERKMNK